jgi:hypothetical protein
MAMRFAADGVSVVDDGEGSVPANQLPSVSTSQIEADEAPKGSGLYSALEEYLTPPTSGNNPEPEKKSEPPAAAATPENTPPVENELKPEEMEKPALLEYLKKQTDDSTNKYKELETKFTELQNQYTTLKNDKSVADPEIDKFFKELKSDFVGTYTKYSSKFDLPDLGLVRAQVTGGGIKARLTQYLESIKPQIEQEFNLEKGTFKFDINEAESNPNSASARYLELKRNYENQLNSEIMSIQQKEKDTADKVKAQQDADFKFIADAHFGGDLQKAKDVFTQMSQVATDVASEKLPFEKHPFAMRNVIRGFLHEQLIQEAKEETAKEIKTQLAQLGVYLPAHVMPTVLTNVKPESGNGDGVKIERNKYSPMEGSIYDTLEAIPSKR